MARRRVIIADLKSNNNYGICTGHYYQVAANYKEVFSKVTETLIASGPIYLDRFKKEEMILLPNDYIVGDSKLKNVMRMVKNGWALRKQTRREDVVILQQSQPAMIIFTLLMTWMGRRNIYQIQYGYEPISRFYLKFLYFFASTCIKGTLCPNETVGKAYKKPYLVLPDYLYTGDMGTDRQDEEKVYDFCSVGRITKDKGVSVTAETMGNLPYSLLIAGQAQDEEERIRIQSAVANSKNIDLKMEYITEENYRKYISGSKYAILNYQGAYSEHSSGVVLDFLFTGVPILGKRCKSLQFVEDEHIGMLYDELKDVDFERLMNEDFRKELQQSIRLYCDKFTSYRRQLYAFIGLRK